MLSEYVGRILRWVDSFAVQLIRWYFSHISQQQLRVVGVEDPTAVLAPPPAVATAPLPPAFEPVLLPSEGNKTEGIGNGDNPTEASSTSQDRGLERHPTFSLRTSNRSSRRGSEKDIFAADFKIDCEDVDVIVFGSINMDIKARAKGEWPVNDSSDFGELSHTAGGKGMNEAVAIARLEVKTAMIGRVGNDEHGAFLKSELARNHVDASNVRGGGKAAADETLGLRWREVKLEEGFSESKKAMEAEFDGFDLEGKLRTDSFVRVARGSAMREQRYRFFEPIDKEMYTGTAVQIVCPEGERKVKYTVTCPEANYDVGRKELDAARSLFEASSSARLSRPSRMMGPLLLLQLELRAEVMLEAIKAAKESAVTVAFRASPLRKGSESLQTALSILDATGVDLIFVNEADAPNLLDWEAGRVLVSLADAEMAASEILERWPELSAVVITCPVAHVFRERRGHAWLRHKRQAGRTPRVSGRMAAAGGKVRFAASLGAAPKQREADPLAAASRQQRLLARQPSLDRSMSNSLSRPSVLLAKATLGGEGSLEREPSGLSAQDGADGEEGLEEDSIDSTAEGDMELVERDEVIVVPRSHHKVVDNIGAADAFVGGFIAAAVLGHSNTRCLLWAHAGAQISCYKEGAQNSLPLPDEIEKLLVYECPAWIDRRVRFPVREQDLSRRPPGRAAPSSASPIEPSSPLGAKPARTRSAPEPRLERLHGDERPSSSLNVGALSVGALNVGAPSVRAPGGLRALSRESSFRDEAAEAAHKDRSHSHMHWDALYSDMHAVWKKLPSTMKLPDLSSKPDELSKLRLELCEMLSWRDFFGLTPCQRAYQCMRLQPRNADYRATLVQLLVAQLLLHPELLLEPSERHADLKHADAPGMATFMKHEAHCFADPKKLFPSWQESDDEAVLQAADDDDEGSDDEAASRARARSKPSASTEGGEPRQSSPGERSRSHSSSQLPGVPSMLRPSRTSSYVNVRPSLWKWDEERDAPDITMGQARALAAQVTLAMLSPEQDAIGEDEAEASHRLIARSVCLILEGDDEPMKAALLKAKAANGTTLLLAACQAGITAIVRTLFDKKLVDETEAATQRAAIATLDPNDMTVKSVVMEGEGEKLLPPTRDVSRRETSMANSMNESSRRSARAAEQPPPKPEPAGGDAEAFGSAFAAGMLAPARAASIAREDSGGGHGEREPSPTMSGRAPSLSPIPLEAARQKSSLSGSFSNAHGSSNSADGPPVDDDARVRLNALEVAIYSGPSQHHREVCFLILKHVPSLTVPERGGLFDRMIPDKEWLVQLRQLQDSLRRAPGSLSAGSMFKERYLVTKFVTDARRVAIADDLENGVPVAVKVTASPEMGELEAKTMAELNKHSPTTAPLLIDNFVCNDPQHQGKRILVLEMGQSVGLHSAVRVKNDKHGMLQRVHAWQLLQCIHALHEICHMVHTDIKSLHFMLFSGEFRLIDYDSCVEEDTEHSNPNYTPEYVSPEVAHAHQNMAAVQMTRAIDVWACGLVLHELFTGERLFDAATTVEQLGGHRGTAWDEHAKAVDELVGHRLDASARAGRLHADAHDILRSMLHAEPTERVLLRDLLQRRFFRPSMSTREMQQVTLLGIFCSPTYRYRGEDPRKRKVPALNLEKEMRQTMRALPFRERELRPAGRLSDIEEVLRGKGSSDVGLSPRILHFSGHGEEAGERNGNRGKLLFVNDDDGAALELDAAKFIELIGKLTPIKNSLECIFLNACCMYESLAKPIHDRFPHISVIAYSTPVEDPAAAAFAHGFYTHIGTELEANRKPSIKQAVAAAEHAWDSGGWIKGNPMTMGRSVHGIYHFLEGQPRSALLPVKGETV